MKTNKKIIENVMNINIKVISIDSKNKEFTTDDGNTYPILFDIDEDITIDEFQIALDESKEIMIKLLEGNE